MSDRTLWSRAARRVNRAAIEPLSNPTNVWHGVQDESLKPLRMLRLGDCSWLSVAHAHTFGPPGYPSVLAERLRARGIALGFDNVHVGTAEEVDPEVLRRFEGRPVDLILIQVATQHGIQEILPLWDAGLPYVRLYAARRLGAAGGAWHRAVTSRMLRRWGRPYAALHPARARAGMHTLLDWIDLNYPGVPCAVLSPHPPLRAGFTDPELVDEAWRLYAAVASARGATVLDYRETLAAAAAGRERDFYGATGYDVLMPGHRVIADALLPWLERAVDRAHAAEAAAVGAVGAVGVAA